ncbi:hypothetical protein E2C01_089477 [Portunus trituberculatus]|uniref:Uncharacterized protein n=1 Tax=Portunus trituberculatus TaxID=210409 RepID=A0A5B7JIW7_PORTR|nr:hypothetical protein [Portunus trituberculatus]
MVGCGVTPWPHLS